MPAPAKKPKIEPNVALLQADANDDPAMIRNHLADHNAKRLKAISDVVITFFERHPNQFYTRFCFEEQLDGFKPGQRKELKEVFKCVKPWQTTLNSDLDLKEKWEELHPTGLEEKKVWANLEQISFLTRSANENFNPNIRKPFEKELSTVAPEGNKWQWIHVPDIPENLANWTW